MAQYYVSIGANEYQVEILNTHARINGESIQAALVALGERGKYLLRKGQWKRELHVQPQGNSQYALNANGKQATVKVEKNTGRARSRVNKAAAGDLKAPISGVVVKVNVKPGDQISEGDVALVLESMKMQMLMRAPVGGVVESVHVSLGARLSKGDLMVKIGQS